MEERIQGHSLSHRGHSMVEYHGGVDPMSWSKSWRSLYSRISWRSGSNVIVILFLYVINNIFKDMHAKNVNDLFVMLLWESLAHTVIVTLPQKNWVCGVLLEWYVYNRHNRHNRHNYIAINLQTICVVKCIDIAAKRLVYKMSFVWWYICTCKCTYTNSCKIVYNV